MEPDRADCSLHGRPPHGPKAVRQLQQGSRPSHSRGTTRPGAARALLVALLSGLLLLAALGAVSLLQFAEPGGDAPTNPTALELESERPAQAALEPQPAAEPVSPAAAVVPPISPDAGTHSLAGAPSLAGTQAIGGTRPVAEAQPAAVQWPVQLVDVTDATGITFQHTDGSSGKRFVIESMTGGLALLDYNQDGALDIYFLNGAPLKGTQVEAIPTNALYRNDGDWHFTDVTAEAGVGDTGYGLGVCAGDYDNDGDADLYVNNFGPNVLYENKGDGTFTDATKMAGVANGHRVGAGTSFLDMDSDGDLDLYAANYIQFSYAEHRPHTRRGLPSYPSPMSYLPDSDTVYRNNGDGTFSDVSVESGVAAHAGTGMGVVCSDYDNDRDLDVFVSNDQRANFLFQNDGSGHFAEVALLAGAALDFGGHPQATMGVDAGDFNNDGLIDLHTTSFAGELASLYRNSPGGLFDDVTRATDAGAGTFPHVTWGNAFADFDNDGHRDLFIACGHLDDNLDQRGGNDTTAYEVPNVLLRNTGTGNFIDVSHHSGDGMRVALSSRGLAVGDLDADGDDDVVVVNSRREPTVLRNDSTLPQHWIQIRLCGVQSNRSGIGARVTVVAGDLVQVGEMHSGRGYQSHFGDPLPFGLGARERIDRVEVQWLGGGTDVIDSPAVDQVLRIVEGSTRVEENTVPVRDRPRGTSD